MCKIGIVCKLFMAETESIDVDIFVKLFFRNKKNQVLLFTSILSDGPERGHARTCRNEVL